ncbi:hypothetical protein GALMADRAFT_159709 [Galerina marginata CBS 339.88]|uniref:CHAT domain-containing protein n=1 Tax=Galerina marginata (strain CBS 339.88) TaxID=685588 RepID=A0A067SJ15_GALM3|nr:hypothetical protein GALMADRAFT_159709 [Galerina marginata CBS 339.88]
MKAFARQRRALARHPPGHPKRSTSLRKLGNALHARFKQLGSMEDLEEAISCHREALALRSSGHPGRCHSLIDLGWDLYRLFQHSGGMENLEETVTSFREAVALSPSGHPDRSISLLILGNVLSTQFQQLGRINDLEDAITSNQEALGLCPPGHPDHSISLNNLGIALYTRFEQLGRIEDLEDAITFHRQALALCPLGHSLRSSSLNNLGIALYTHFKQLGKIEDLEDAITFHCQALALCPLGHPDHSTSLSNLGIALDTRFEQLGRMEDLEDTITLHRQALALRPLGHPDQPMSLSNLGNVLLTHFEQLGKIEDLEKALTFHHQALALRPLGHPFRSSSLICLGNAFETCFEQLGRIEDIEEAIIFYRQAIDICPQGRQYYSMFLNNLGIALLSCFKKSGRIKDLEDAITSYRQAIAYYSLGNPLCSMSLNNLGLALLSQFDQSGRTEDLEESFLLYKQAANDITSHSQHRLRAAIDWAAKAQEYHHNSVLSAYTISLHLLDRCLISHPDIESQQSFLATAHVPESLASDAASAAINAGNLELAVELLEQGRAILWSKMDGYRYPLDQLCQVEGGAQLADRLKTLNAELEPLVLSSGSRPLDSAASMSITALDTKMRRHRILSEEWEDVVGKIRKIEGFGSFLQAVPFNTLQMAAAEGPVILVNISNYRSDVIILYNTFPILVALSKVQRGELSAQAKDLHLVQNTVSVLRKLWDNIVSPVVDSLTQLGVPEKSRIWWCPTAELCGLPLHAAGPYRSGQKNLPDIYTSSYISTLSALIKARSNIIAPSSFTVPKLLVIGQPGGTLQNVQNEIDIIQQLGNFVDNITGAEATQQAVLSGLTQHSWAHFACHGHLGDNGQPFQASFELHDGHHLTLLDLIQARLPDAEVAFLSACHTAAGGFITPDETIHLAAALQFCGFRSVVGTLWEMDDNDGPIISKEFYKYMFRNPGKMPDFKDSAQALNLATRAMRRNGVPLERWVMFVHIGA